MRFDRFVSIPLAALLIAILAGQGLATEQRIRFVRRVLDEMLSEEDSSRFSDEEINKYRTELEHLTGAKELPKVAVKRPAVASIEESGWTGTKEQRISFVKRVLEEMLSEEDSSRYSDEEIAKYRVELEHLTSGEKHLKVVHKRPAAASIEKPAWTGTKEQRINFVKRVLEEMLSEEDSSRYSDEEIEKYRAELKSLE